MANFILNREKLDVILTILDIAIGNLHPALDYFLIMVQLFPLNGKFMLDPAIPFDIISLIINSNS